MKIDLHISHSWRYWNQDVTEAKLYFAKTYYRENTIFRQDQQMKAGNKQILSRSNSLLHYLCLSLSIWSYSFHKKMRKVNRRTTSRWKAQFTSIDCLSELWMVNKLANSKQRIIFALKTKIIIKKKGHNLENNILN